MSDAGALDVSNADVTIIGIGPNGYFGWDVAGGGDVDNDGFDDLLVGAPGLFFSSQPEGYVSIISGGPALPAVLDSATDSTAILVGDVIGDDFGHSVTGIGDINGDGFDDVTVGAPLNDGAGNDAGAAYAFVGPFAGLLEAGRDEASAMEGSTSGARAGWSLASLDDWDGDGGVDLVVGACGSATVPLTRALHKELR